MSTSLEKYSAQSNAMADYLRNYWQGLQKMLKGESGVMREIPKAWDVVPQVALTFTPESDNEVWERLTSEVAESAKRNGIELWETMNMHGKPGRGPMHLTCTHLMPQKMKREDLDKAARFVEEDSEMGEIAKQFQSIEIVADHLITNGQDVMLVSSSPPPELQELREAMGNRFSEAGYDPSVRNFVYINLARLKKLPEKGQLEALNAFARDLMAIEKELRAKPIVLKEEAVYRGNYLYDSYRFDI